jgi:tetratricopeptide (TPR) repeat protein
MPASAPVATLHEADSSPPVLGYGTKRYWNQRRVAGLVLLIAVAHPAAWWSRVEMRQWIADRRIRAVTRIQMDQNLSQCADSISHGQWRDAQVSIDRARLAACAYPDLFSRAELNAFTKRIDKAQASLQNEEARVMQATTQGHVLWYRRFHEQSLRPIRIRPDAIADLIDAADRAMHRGGYGDAVQLLQQAIVLDPSNQPALELLRQANEHLPSSRPAG